MVSLHRLLAATLVAVTIACGGGSSPTTPASPAPSATPAPAPTPTPNAFAAACGTPLPAINDLYGFAVKVQLEPSKNKKILNASPIVKNPDYCQAVDQPGQLCRTRIETNPERVPCDHYLSGISDENRPGPTWYQEVDGKRLRCGGLGLPGDAPDCSLKEENQYLLDVRQPGKYIACAGKGSNGSCGVCVLAEGSFGEIHRSPAGLCGLSGTLD